MERELWPIITAALSKVARPQSSAHVLHSTMRIACVYLWAVLHDRPVSWACHRCNWRGGQIRNHLPSQSTMSRRLREPQTRQMLCDLLDQLEPATGHALMLRMDAKALTVAKHSGDGRATFGRGAGGLARGYKIHAIYAENSRPVTYRVAPLNVDERTVAREMMTCGELGEGYLLADSNYETNPLYDLAAQVGRTLVTPRRFKKAKGLGQSRVHSKHRVAMIARMNSPSGFTRELLADRRQVETHWANLCNFGGGLVCLPPWVRNHRVELYVQAKIIIRAARDQANQRRQRA